MFLRNVSTYKNAWCYYLEYHSQTLHSLFFFRFDTLLAFLCSLLHIFSFIMRCLATLILIHAVITTITQLGWHVKSTRPSKEPYSTVCMKFHIANFPDGRISLLNLYNKAVIIGLSALNNLTSDFFVIMILKIQRKLLVVSLIVYELV
jgi:hypothetical protein